jgi:hypothetical protein
VVLSAVLLDLAVNPGSVLVRDVQQVICKECATAGEKSRVYHAGTSTTLMAYNAYWDENGQRHFHDGNDRVSKYFCSNGHSWHEVETKQCPTEGCDLNG